MSHDLSLPHSLTGHLLLAVPSLKEPPFARSVIYLAAHSVKEGAFGYILNRPLKQNIGDLMEDSKLGPLAKAPVFVGGPVAADKLAFASMRWSKARQRLKIQTHLSVENAQHEMSMGRAVCGFVGYSGWGRGQLENELKRRSWIISTAGRQVLAGRHPEDMWRDVLNEMGPLFGLMAGTPEKVELN